MDTSTRIEICQFPQGRRLAVTLSFDDGVIEDRRLIAYFNDHGLKGTFNLNSCHLGVAGKPVSDGQGHILADEVPSLYRGHEVAIHTFSHPHLPQLPNSTQIIEEVLEDRKILEDLVGYPVRGMAYPFGTYSPKVIEVLRTLGIVYCRTTQQEEVCFPPEDPLAWHTTSHIFTTTPADIATRFAQWYESPRKIGVFFVWGHSYEFARPRERWEELPKLFGPLAGYRDVWYCTNIELFDYQAARERLVIAANRKTAYNPSALTVSVRVNGRLLDISGGQVVSLI